MNLWLPVVVATTVPLCSALADNRTIGASEQLAGLFMQSCVRFAGNAPGLRRWIDEVKLPALPPPGQQAFLKGRPGIAYDATNPEGKFVVLSGEDGSCSAVAERADAAALVGTLEKYVQQAGLRMEPSGERDDPEEKALHWRYYRLSKNGRDWPVTAGTASGPAGGQAILTIAPR